MCSRTPCVRHVVRCATLTLACIDRKSKSQLVLGAWRDVPIRAFAAESPRSIHIVSHIHGNIYESKTHSFELSHTYTHTHIVSYTYTQTSWWYAKEGKPWPIYDCPHEVQPIYFNFSFRLRQPFTISWLKYFHWTMYYMYIGHASIGWNDVWVWTASSW